MEEIATHQKKILISRPWDVGIIYFPKYKAVARLQSKILVPNRLFVRLPIRCIEVDRS